MKLLRGLGRSGIQRRLAIESRKSTVDDSSIMGPSQEPILRQVPTHIAQTHQSPHPHASKKQREGNHSRIEERQQLNLTRSVPPIPHELAGDGEHGHDLNTGGAHAVVGVVGGLEVEGTGGVGVGEDGVAFGSEGESEEGGADLEEDLNVNDGSRV